MICPPALAVVLREATTNILRHARPERVSMGDRIAVTNDGAPVPEGPLALGGLDTLRRRIRASRGELDLEHAEGSFTLRARLTEADRC